MRIACHQYRVYTQVYIDNTGFHALRDNRMIGIGTRGAGEEEGVFKLQRGGLVSLALFFSLFFFSVRVRGRPMLCSS
jgi:hypothetical protein